MCGISLASGQTTRPGQEDPKQEQAPPEDSPEPLGNVRRPYQALFGGADRQPQGRTLLNFNGSVSQVYDRDEVDNGEPQLGGSYTNLTGDLDYEREGSRVKIAATGGANLRYYNQLSEFLAGDYHGGLGAETRMASHTTLRLNGAVSYSPVALPSVFGTPLPPDLGDPLPPTSNFAVTNDRFVTAATTASFEHGFSVRSQFIVRGSYRYSDYLAEDTPTNDWSMLDSGAVYRYRVTSTRSLRVGYNYRRANYAWAETPGGAGPEPDENNLFVGVAVDRAFSGEQRTTISLEGGTSVFGGTATTALRGGDRLRFVFDAAVAHQIGKTWLLLGSFNRGSQFDQGYGGPVFGDAASLSATGFFNTRTDITAWLEHTEGESLLAIAGQQFTTTTGGARLRFALSRRWALTAEYFRYLYDFTQSPGRPFLFGVPERFARHSIRGGVLVFLPIGPR
jgi:hypothetical protein